MRVKVNHRKRWLAQRVAPPSFDTGNKSYRISSAQLRRAGICYATDADVHAGTDFECHSSERRRNRLSNVTAIFDDLPPQLQDADAHLVTFRHRSHPHAAGSMSRSRRAV